MFDVSLAQKLIGGQETITTLTKEDISSYILNMSRDVFELQLYPAEAKKFNNSTENKIKDFVNNNSTTDNAPTTITPTTTTPTTTTPTTITPTPTTTTPTTTTPTTTTPTTTTPTTTT